MNKEQFFDSSFDVAQQLPRHFRLTFEEVNKDGKAAVKVILNNISQLGDTINDNSYQNDFYRYHDVFHYSFAVLLGWSPCTRAMMKRKRKSDVLIDEIEDGARAIITEEALSMIIFCEAKKVDYFKDKLKVSKSLLENIKAITENFEVKIRTKQEWELAILKSYEIFRLLIANRGGTIEFNAFNKEIKYI